jgi:hypothetical protein
MVPDCKEIRYVSEGCSFGKLVTNCNWWTLKGGSFAEKDLLWHCPNSTNVHEYFLLLQRKSNFDIDHIVIPYSMSSTRVEKLKYKVLLTYLLHKEIFTCVPYYVGIVTCRHKYIRYLKSCLDSIYTKMCQYLFSFLRSLIEKVLK